VRTPRVPCLVSSNSFWRCVRAASGGWCAHRFPANLAIERFVLLIMNCCTSTSCQCMGSGTNYTETLLKQKHIDGQELARARRQSTLRMTYRRSYFANFLSSCWEKTPPCTCIAAIAHQSQSIVLYRWFGFGTKGMSIIDHCEGCLFRLRRRPT
jgi:hypothetical protein